MSRHSAPNVMLPAWATAWKMARWLRFMWIDSSYQLSEKDVLDLSIRVTLRIRASAGQPADRRGPPVSGEYHSECRGGKEYGRPIAPRPVGPPLPGVPRRLAHRGDL